MVILPYAVAASVVVLLVVAWPHVPVEDVVRLTRAAFLG